MSSPQIDALADLLTDMPGAGGPNMPGPERQPTADELARVLVEPEVSRVKGLVSTDESADERARDLGLARQMNVPTPLVTGRAEQLKREARLNLGPVYDDVRANPALRLFLLDPDHATIAKDDLENLSRVAREYGAQPRLSPPPGGTMAYLRSRFARGFDVAFDMPSAVLPVVIEALGGPKASPDAHTRVSLYRTQPPPRDPSGQLETWLGDAAEQLPILASTGVGAAKGAAVGAAVGSVWPGIGTAAGAGTGAWAGMYVSSFETETAAAYLEYAGLKDAQGQPVTEQAAAASAVLVGAVNAGIELVAMKWLVSILPGGKYILEQYGKKAAAKAIARAALSNPTLGRAVAGVAAGIVKAAAGEAGEEIAQEYAGIQGKRFLTGQPMGPVTAPEAAQIAGAGAAAFRATAVFGLAGAPVNVVADRITQSRANAEHVGRIEKMVGASETATRSPEAMEALLKGLAEQKGQTTIGMPVRELMTLYQEKGGLEALEEDVPGVREQMPEALATNGDIEIPVERYYSRVAKRLGDDARRYVRLTPGALTLSEAEHVEATANDQIERFAEEAAQAAESETDLDALEQYQGLVEQQLVSAGEAKAVAKLQAELLGTRLRVRAQRLGVPVRQLMSEENLTIQGPAAQEEQTKPSLLERLAREKENRSYEELLGLIRQIRAGAEPELEGLPRVPVLTLLKRRGGVDPASPLASELEAVGVPRKGKGSLPGLFRRGGMKGFDTLDLSGEPLFATELARRGTNTLEPQTILDAIEAEIKTGTPLRTEEELAAIEEARRPREELRAEIERAGLSLSTLTDEEVLEGLKRVAQTYEQPAVAPIPGEFDLVWAVREGRPIRFLLWRGFGDAAASVDDRPNNAMLGRAKYFTDSIATAEVFAAARINGRIEQRVVELRKPFYTELLGWSPEKWLGTWKASEEYQRFDEILKREGLPGYQALANKRDGFWKSAREMLAKKYGDESGAWPGAERLRSLVEEAGFDGIVDVMSDNPDLPNHTQVAVFGNAPKTYEQPAFHGTPHRGIERFSTDRIGTGEGAQVYGWGLYFTTKKQIAEWYRKNLSGKDREILEYDGRELQLGGPWNMDDQLRRTLDLRRMTDEAKLNNRNSDSWQADLDESIKEMDEILDEEALKHIDYSRAGTDDFASAKAVAIMGAESKGREAEDRASYFRSVLKLANDNPRRSVYERRMAQLSLDQSEYEVKVYEKLKEKIQALDPKRFRVIHKRAGQVYEVDLPEQSELLNFQVDYDKQPEIVKRAIETAITDIKSKIEPRELPERQPAGPRWVLTVPSRRTGRAQLSGSGLYESMEDALRAVEDGRALAFLRHGLGEAFYKYLSDILGGDRQASEYLMHQGVRGHSYTGSTSGETNFVIYDADAIKILNTFYQPAWHGTPHRFDRFDITKIGTGEGAQAFGWGLYFSSKKGVAEFYRDTMSLITYSFKSASVNSDVLTLQGVADALEAAGLPDSPGHVLSVLQAAGSAMVDAEDPQTWIDEAVRRNLAFAKIVERDHGDTTRAEGFRETAAEIAKLNPADFSSEKHGQLVEATIPDDDELLDWDKPMSRQPEKVRDALAPLIREFRANRSDFASPSDTRVDRGSGFYAWLAWKRGRSDQAASQELDALGIKGHRYKSESSKPGERTINYVIYSDRAVEIARTLYQPFGGDTSVRGSLTFDPQLRNAVMRLTAARDLSTFHHEAGHLFLAELSKDALRPDAPQQVMDDLNTVLAHLGAASVEELTTEQHERFARGFEAYLWEGKAPSLELRALFDRFKLWLRRVYAKLRDLDSPLTDEIREVYDRLLATDGELAAVRSADRYRALFDAKTDAMTAAEFEQYKALEERMLREEQSELDRRALRDLARQRTAEWRAQYAAIRAEVEREVNAKPVFMAAHFLRTGEAPPGMELPEGVEPMKLSRQALVEMYGPEIEALLSRSMVREGNRVPLFAPDMVRVKGGVHPDEVATIFGFRSGDEMVQALAASGDRRQTIKAETDARMKAAHNDLIASGRLEEEARHAALSSSRIDLLFTEERVLSRKTGKQASPRRVLLDTAERVVLGRKYRELRASKFATVAEREASAAITAAHKGDLDAARTHKRAQILNMLLERETRDAKAATDRAIKQIRLQLEPAAQARLGKAGHGLLEQMNGLLERFDFAKVTDKAAHARQALADWITEQERNGESVAIAPELRNEAFRIPYREMTVEQLLALRDAVVNIAAIARHENKLLAERFKENYNAIVERVRTSIFENNKLLEPSKNLSPDLRERLVSGLKDFHARSNKLEFLFWKLDGWQELGPVWDVLFRPIVEAEEAEQARMRAIVPQLEKLWSVYTWAERKDFYRKRWFPEVQRNISKMELLEIARHRGNPYNWNALLEGFGWTPEQGENVLLALDKRDWDHTQAVLDFIDQFWPEIAALQKKLTGLEPAKVKAEPVQTRFGEYRGGYYPLVADAKKSYRAFQMQEREHVKDLFGGNYTLAQTRRGHTINRVGFGGQPVLLDGSVLPRHVQNVIHDLTHREAILDVNRLTQDGRIREAIEQTAGPEAYRSIRPWLANIARDYAESDLGGLGWLIRYARTGSTIANMGLKVTVGVSQVAGILPSIDRIGWRAVAKGIRMAINLEEGPQGTQRWVDFVLERSEAMRNRQQSFDREARDLMRGVPKDGLIASRNEFFMKFTGMMDMAVSIPTWLGAYDKAMTDFKGDERKAILFADQVVRQTQASGLAKDLAQFQRGGDLARLMTQFYSFWAGQYAMYAARIGQFRAGRIDFSEFMASAMWLWFVPALLTALMVGQGPDDDDEWLQWAAIQLGFYPFQSIVGVRDLSRYLQSAAQGRYTDFQPFPAVDAFGTPVKAIAQLGHDALEGGLRRSTVRSTLESVGYWGHLPSRQAWITGEAMWDMAQGDEVGLEHLFFARTKEERRK